MTLAINSASMVCAQTPQFREKDAVCIEARAIGNTAGGNITGQARPQHVFQNQPSHLYVLAQMQRQQSALSAGDVITAYRQGATSIAASRHEIRI